MSICAVIDVGTNSVKLLVAEASAEKVRVLCDRVCVVRLGEGCENTLLAPAAMQRAAEAITDMVRTARSLGAEKIAAVGTQALRAAGNADDFIRTVELGSGVRIRVLSGEEEARLSFLAATSDVAAPGKTFAVFDIGGGSTEVVFGNGEGLLHSHSYPVGALVLHERYFSECGSVVPDSLLTEARRSVRCLFGSRVPVAPAVDGYLGVGGTWTTIASVALRLAAYDNRVVDGSVLEKAELERQLQLYARTSVGEREKIAGLAKERADIILAGACIAMELLERYEISRVVVRDRGVRYGVMRSLLCGDVGCG
jgi:Exopolyphosphatase